MIKSKSKHFYNLIIFYSIILYYSIFEELIKNYIVKIIIGEEEESREKIKNKLYVYRLEGKNEIKTNDILDLAEGVAYENLDFKLYDEDDFNILIYEEENLLRINSGV